jgi:hypothetical protein
MLLKRAPGKTALQQERGENEIQIPWGNGDNKEERKTEQA